MKDSQLELFVHKSNKKHNCKTRVCNRCNVKKPLTMFYEQKNGIVRKNKKVHRHHTCITCWNVAVGLRRKLALENKCDQTNCDCCGKKSDTLNLDHNHITDKFRGWLCPNCNTGIGKLGDNVEGLTNALKYLEKCEEENG